MVAITSSLPTMYGACVLSATYWFREIEHPLQRLEFCSTYFYQWDMQQIFFLRNCKAECFTRIDVINLKPN